MANSVEPIRDMEKIKEISEYLKVSSRHGQRNQLMFLMGINFGLRISRLLELKVRDVRDKHEVYLRENKRNKERKCIINSELKTYVDAYIKDKADYEYLFSSQKGVKAISRVQAYDILREAGQVFGLDKIGAHTLRKTYGWIIYTRSGKDPVAVKEALNVGSVEVALRYIGVIKDQSSNIIRDLKITT